MSEGRLRSLEKCFFFYFWRRNGEVKKKSQVKKKLNSVNGGRKMEKGESRKEKKGDKKSRGPILGPHT